MPPLCLSRVCHRSSASGLHRRPSSSLMVPSWLSPLVLTLGLPLCALSGVHFVSPCPPLAPLPLTCIGSHLCRPWCYSAHLNGCRRLPPMVCLPSSSTVGPCDRRASARVDHQHVGLQLGRHLAGRGQLAGAILSAALRWLQHLRVLLLWSHCVVWTLPVGDLFDTIHPSCSSLCHCKQCSDSAIPSVCAGMTLLYRHAHIHNQAFDCRLPTYMNSSPFHPFFHFLLTWPASLSSFLS
jgi:hypothetical protein